MPRKAANDTVGPEQFSKQNETLTMPSNVALSYEKHENHPNFLIMYTHIQLCYGHYTGQPVLASTPSSQLEDFVAAKFYCLHALDSD